MTDLPRHYERQFQQNRSILCRQVLWCQRYRLVLLCHFLDSGFTEVSTLAASLGFGLINWLFPIPAIYTIDTFGRRNLLLTTFPILAITLLFTGFSFWIQERTARIACVALGIYLFGIAYSPGEGPVPFTYSAEAYPLYVRTYGMSLATATTWFLMPCCRLRGHRYSLPFSLKALLVGTRLGTLLDGGAFHR